MTAPAPANAASTRLLTVAQLIDAHPGLAHGSVRADIFHAESNGLAACGALVRRGRRVLIDEHLYIAWLRERSGEPLRPADYRPQRQRPRRGG